MKTKKHTVWFAAGGGIAQYGPFATQIEATNAIRLARPKNTNGVWTRFPPDAFVWPEEVRQERRRR